ncbi:MAG: hypothetical protein ISS88_01130 [Candidatus Portnoybacteria bacterium]|nr:hypothetical protein [Candidatus Portnoybacteria bacterium]
MKKKKKVVVVNDKSESLTYGSWLEILKRAAQLNGKAEVEIVQTPEWGLKKVEQGNVDTLVFISGSMLDEARQIQENHPSLKVVIFAGQIPKKEVILIDKGWRLSTQEIQYILL